MQSKLVVAASMTLALAGGLNTPVHAQASDGAPFKKGATPVRVLFGGFIPSYSTTRKAIKSLFLGGGATFDLRKTAPDSAVVSAYFDATNDDSEKNGLAARLSVVGLGGQFRYNLNGKSAPLKLYIGSGAGVYVIGAKKESLINSRFVSKNKTYVKLGGKLLGGLETKSGVFGELSYTTVGATNDLNASGVGFALGMRL